MCPPKHQEIKSARKRVGERERQGEKEVEGERERERERAARERTAMVRN